MSIFVISIGRLNIIRSLSNIPKVHNVMCYIEQYVDNGGHREVFHDIKFLV